MNIKKELRVYYLLVCEGKTEFNIFAYLTKIKFREFFEKSNTKFSNKVEIAEIGISQGVLGGVGSIGDFKAKYDLIKNKYSGQRLFFLLDKDLDDSLKIEGVIKAGGDIVQFLEYNSEYLLLKLTGKNPKKPVEFKNMGEFKDYIDSEFEKQFKKKASELKDCDLDLIFAKVDYNEVRITFGELFSTLS